MNSNTQFWLTISVLLALGAVFLAVGCYAIGDYVIRYLAEKGVAANLSQQAQRATIIGVGGLVLGSVFTRKGVQWLQETKPKPQSTVDFCPFCGAMIEKNETQCQKCGNQLPLNGSYNRNQFNGETSSLV